MNYTAEIKSRLPAREVLEFYGLTVDRAGFCKCPFHQGDNTGSLKVYDGSGGWHCFGCGAGSSVIDFVMLHFGLPFRAAQERLNDDFRLGLPIGRELSPAEQARIAAEARQQRAEAQERERQTRELREKVDHALTAYALLDKYLTKTPMRQLLKRPNTGTLYARRENAWYIYLDAERNLSAFLANSRAGKQEKS